MVSAILPTFYIWQQLFAKAIIRRISYLVQVILSNKIRSKNKLKNKKEAITHAKERATADHWGM